MKIRVGCRFPKIKALISVRLRVCRLIGSLVRTISTLMSQDRTSPSSSFVCLQRPQVARSPLPVGTRDLVAFGRRRKMAPKGCVAVYVGEERQRFVIPIMYLNHPFITKLLANEGDGEWAYSYRGPLTVPCDVGDFEQLKWLVDRETTAASQNFRA